MTVRLKDNVRNFLKEALKEHRVAKNGLSGNLWKRERV